ncbi:MAG: YMGG-like glycine zipper-containing protein [Gemmatimonadaceae bacterium]
MRVNRLSAVVAATFALAACGKSESARIDDALRNDLSLASATQPYMPQQYVSPVEQGYAPQPGYYPQGYAPQPYYQQAPQPVVYRGAPQPRVIRRAPAPVYNEGGVYRSGSGQVQKNTKRDAIIGAAAGAAIGVASTRNTLKGAIIGAAAGGLLGAVIGEKIDVRHPQ